MAAYMFYGLDGPDGLAIRKATRPAHIDFIKSLGVDGGAPAGAGGRGRIARRCEGRHGERSLYRGRARQDVHDAEPVRFFLARRLPERGQQALGRWR
jgi:hypothetical protein